MVSTISDKEENNIKILHLDDDEEYLNISKRMLLQIGNEIFDITTMNDFESLEEVSEKLESFDIIICDLEMPKIDGLELLSYIRRKKANFPFILLTGKGREEVAIKALNLGANYYINKSLDVKTQFQELKHAIINVVSNYRTEKALQESEDRYKTIFEENPIAIIETDWSVLWEIQNSFEEQNITNYEEYFTNHPEILEKIASNIVVLKANKATLKLYGATELSQVVGPLNRYFVPETYVNFKEDVIDLLKGKETLAKRRLKRKISEKGEIHTLLTLTRIKGLENPYKKVLIAIKNITEEILAQDARSIAEFKNEAILNAIPGLVFQLDKNSTFISYWGQSTDLYLPPEEFIGKTCKEIFPEDLAKKIVEKITETLQGKKNVQFEYTLFMKERNQYREFEARMVPYGENQVLSIVREVTEINKTKRIILENEKRYSTLFKKNPIAEAERDYSEVKKYLSDLNIKDKDALSQYLQKSPETVFNCAKLIKLVEVNQATLDLFEVDTPEEFSKLIPLKFLDQPNAYDAFVKQLVLINDNVIEQSTLVKFETSSGKKKMIEIHQIDLELEEKHEFKNVWTIYVDITKYRI